MSNALTSCHHFHPFKFEHVLNFSWNEMLRRIASFSSKIMGNYDIDSFECVAHTSHTHTHTLACMMKENNKRETTWAISTTQERAFIHTEFHFFRCFLSIWIQTLCITQILFLGMHRLLGFSCNSEKLIAHLSLTSCAWMWCVTRRDSHTANHQFRNSHNANCVMWRGIEFCCLCKLLINKISLWCVHFENYFFCFATLRQPPPFLSVRFGIRSISFYTQWVLLIATSSMYNLMDTVMYTVYTYLETKTEWNWAEKKGE